MTIKKYVPVIVTICAIIIAFAVVISITYMLAHKPKPTAGISVTICPPEKQVEMARFINDCSGAQSEAFCYALARAEYCSVVRRF